MNEQDDFNAMFAEAIATEVVADTKTEIEIPPEPVAEVIPPVVELAPVAEPVAEVIPPVVELAPVAEPVAVIPEPVKVVQPEPEPVAEPEFNDPVFTEEQNKALAQFQKDWPEVAEAQKTLLAHELAKQEVAFRKTMHDLAKQVYSDMAPIANNYVVSAQEKHMAEIKAVHSDLNEQLPKLKTWIDQQPGYLQKAMDEVYSKGTSSEVIDLVTRFKKETIGVEPQVPDLTTQQKPAVDEAKVAALAPVTSKRTVVATKGVDPDDYKGAFAEAVKQG